MIRLCFKRMVLGFVLSCMLVQLNVFASNLSVIKSKLQYYLSAVIGENSFLKQYDDYILYVSGLPVAGFSKIRGELIDCYFYVSSEYEIDSIIELFKNSLTEINAISEKLYPALLKYRETCPSYFQDNLYRMVGEIVKKNVHVDLTLMKSIFNLYEKKYGNEMNANLFQYLRSNGITSIEEIEKNPGLIRQICDKFYMSSHTFFFRNWEEIKSARPFLYLLKEKIKKLHVPFKAKIYACSTGEEVLSFAIELFEDGIDDFTILASDINESSLLFAEHMEYPVSLIGMNFQEEQFFYKYFFLDKDNILKLKNPDLFRSRIRYVKCDLLEDLPSNLESRFSPPYDLIAMNNVLMYLEDEKIQQKKSYWLNVLNPGGIFIEVDIPLMSGASRIFGEKWMLRNFKVINRSVNIKLDHGLD